MERQNVKFFALLIFVMTFCTLIVYSTYVREQNIITYFGTGQESIRVYGDKNICQVITIEGDSMLPTITSSNTVIAENVSFFGIDNIRVGDIIVFERDSKIICHRVVEIHDGYFNVKGDGNGINDPDGVSFNSVRFVVVAVLR